MADGEPRAPIRRRTRRSSEAPSPDADDRHAEGVGDRRAVPDESDTRGDQDDREASAGAAERGETSAEGPPRGDPGVVARRAASLVASLSGRRPESVISIERKDKEWHVGVEVVEVSRIPDSADILAVYDVRLDRDGELISYRRVRRYARGQMDCERRR
jgi:Gas vesicle synthesis protein GvpO